MEPDHFQRLLLAASFASTQHRDQVRADGVTPYISHVFRVALVLRHHFGVDDDDTLIIALLHDTLEDTNTDYEQIAEQFGNKVADGVVLLTKNPLLPKNEREIDYKNRLKDAPESVRIAKLADVYDNLSGRIGTAKMPRTIGNAIDLTTMFAPIMRTPKGKAAVLKVEALVKRLNTPEILSPAPLVAAPIGTQKATRAGVGSIKATKATKTNAKKLTKPTKAPKVGKSAKTTKPNKIKAALKKS